MRGWRVEADRPCKSVAPSSEHQLIRAAAQFVGAPSIGSEGETVFANGEKS